jgi:hypothetical protein
MNDTRTKHDVDETDLMSGKIDVKELLINGTFVNEMYADNVFYLNNTNENED